MSPSESIRKGKRSALAGIADFFRQLSLFDPVPSLFPPPAPKTAAEPPTPKSDLFNEIPAFAELCRGRFAHIRVHGSKRLWETWRVAWTRRNESLRLDIPASLESAPLEVKEALLEWALLVSRRNRRGDTAVRIRRGDLENLIRSHLRLPVSGEVGSAAFRRLERNRRRMQRLRPMGRNHDLDEAFRRINSRYFEGKLEAKLTWSARLGGLSTHSVAQDGEGNPYHLISISRGYDTPEATPEILDGVVYHECLHIAIPPRRENGRRVVHGEDFRERERAYEHYEAWRRWHRYGLPKVLRRLERGVGDVGGPG